MELSSEETDRAIADISEELREKLEALSLKGRSVTLILLKAEVLILFVFQGDGSV